MQNVVREVDGVRMGVDVSEAGCDENELEWSDAKPYLKPSQFSKNCIIYSN